MTTPSARESDDPPAAPQPRRAVHESRLQLIWDVAVFQLKLVADSLLDVLLSPLSIGAAILGLTAGGDDPERYFRRLLRAGRRLELWINLFAPHHRRGTADEMMDGLRERVFTEAASNPWLSRAGSRLNEKLDNVNASTSAASRSAPQSPVAKEAPPGGDAAGPAP